MDRDILLLIIGGSIGFLSSILSGLILFLLEQSRIKRQWDREGKLRREQWQREDALRKEEQQFEEIERIRSWNQNTSLEELRRRLNEGEPVVVDSSGHLRVPSGRLACFPASTQVMLSNKMNISIEQIKVGDHLLSFDIASHSFKIAVVEDVQTQDAKELIVINKRIRTTSSHSFYANQEWVRAEDLKLNNVLLSKDLGFIRIISLELQESNGKVYAVYTTNSLPFFVEGVLVQSANLKGL